MKLKLCFIEVIIDGMGSDKVFEGNLKIKWY